MYRPYADNQLRLTKCHSCVPPKQPAEEEVQILPPRLFLPEGQKIESRGEKVESRKNKIGELAVHTQDNDPKLAMALAQLSIHEAIVPDCRRDPGHGLTNDHRLERPM